MVFSDYSITGFFYLFLFTVFLYVVQKILFRYLVKKCRASSRIGRDVFLAALNVPLGVGILLSGLTFAVAAYLGRSSGLFLLAVTCRTFGFIFLLTWFVLRLINQLANRCSSIKLLAHVDPNVFFSLLTFFKILACVASFLSVLHVLGVRITSILTFGGVLAAGVAFAAQDLLANFFGGLLIYLDRPFAVGDSIHSLERPIEGIVEHIGWRLSRLRTLDKRSLFVPNGRFNATVVENRSKATNRRIKTHIKLRYSDVQKVPLIVDEVKSMLIAHPEIDLNQPVIVNLVELASFSLVIMVQCFTKTTKGPNFQQVQQTILFDIMALVSKHGGDFALPTVTLYCKNKNASFDDVLK